MRREDFEELVADGFKSLSEKVRAKIKNVALLVEDEPSREIRAREGLAADETLLGYYQGVPLSDRGDHYGVGATMPDTITLYQKPIEEEAAEVRVRDTLTFEDAVRKVVAETVWHEFAHHFGIGEYEVRVREEKRQKNR